MRNVELQEANARITAAEEETRNERDVTRAINTFVNDDLLGQASPEEEPDRDVKLRTVLDRAAAAIGERFTDQSLVEAAIRLTIGTTYLSLGEYDRAAICSWSDPIICVASYWARSTGTRWPA